MGLWIFLAVIVLLALWAIGIYNRLVSLRNRFKNAFSQIDVQLKRRYDLIPNLVESVKGYMQHERGTLDAVIKARNSAMAAQGTGGAVAAENQLTGALRGLMALAEAYPDLKANTNFQQLQGELSDIENKLAASRRFFNNAVQEYNTGIQNFLGLQEELSSTENKVAFARRVVRIGHLGDRAARDRARGRRTGRHALDGAYRPSATEL